MKQYVIDEIRPLERQKLQAYLDGFLQKSALPGIYHLVLPGEILSGIQTGHAECQPFYVALELLEDQLVCELLVRTGNHIRCDCQGYVSPEQLAWVIRFIDAILAQLEICA